jgi:zinc protease
MPLAPVRRVLPNGLTVIVQANRLIPAVSLAVGMQAGATMEAPECAGTAALTARLLDKGTARLDRDALAEAVEGRGASLTVGAGRQQIVVSATCLADDLAEILPLVCDVARRPSLPEDEVVTRRGELLTAILEAEDDPGAVAVDALLAALYPGVHPLGRPVRGTAATVRGLGRRDVAAFHAQWCQPSTTTIVAVGDLDPLAAVEAIAAQVEDWAGAAVRPPVPEPPPPATRRTMIERPVPGKSQADIAYGFVGLARGDADYYAAVVMNHALGQYALGGRLGDSIRERQGMAYYVYSSLDAGLAAGPFLVRAGVAAENIARTIESIDAELRAVLDQGFTAGEIEDSRRYLVGSLPRQLETNAGIAGFLLAAELYGLGIDFDVRLPGLIDGVGYDDAMRVARRLLDPSRATIAVAGPLA